MDILNTFFDNLMILANAMSFYILLGLLIAGALKQIIPNNFISSHLGTSKTSSVIKATLFGIPMPVCSCSVIPLAKSLQKEGASKGAVQSFLISTPITGADSILATYSFFGWIFTIYRVITSIIIAIVTGILQNYFDNKERINSLEEDACCSTDSSCGCSSQKEIKEEVSCCSSNSSSSCGGEKEHKTESCCSSEESKGESSCCSSDKKSGFLSNTFNYAFVTLFGDIYFSLFIGLIFGALFTTFLPKELLSGIFEYQFLTYIAVLIIAMPLYVCATASLPIAGAFILSGMSGGAAFVFLSAGPATNSVTMGVVASMFGKRSLFIYIGTIALFSIFFGYIFDMFFSNLMVDMISEHSESSSLLDYISTAIMFLLIGFYMIKRFKK